MTTNTRDFFDLENISFDTNDCVDAYIVYCEDNLSQEALKLCNELRMSGFKVDMDYMNRSLKANFKQADNLKAHFVIILGEELKEDLYTVKNNHTKEEEKINKDYIQMYLDEQLMNECDCGCCDCE
mgnify:CR=1 FL=1